MQESLFGPTDQPDQILGDGAVVLRGRARRLDPVLGDLLAGIVAQAPFRQMTTPGGRKMSVGMTNCGGFGWVSDSAGYRYDPVDPQTGRLWPAIPPPLRDLACTSAAQAGFAGFDPDACLINQYPPGAKLSLHQDKDEADFSQPIVSVSLGLAAVFLFGGLSRAEATQKVGLEHGDVVVWGGPARLRYHGVSPVKDGEHPLLGRRRINLTFRKVV